MGRGHEHTYQLRYKRRVATLIDRLLMASVLDGQRYSDVGSGLELMCLGWTLGIRDGVQVAAVGVDIWGYSLKRVQYVGLIWCSGIGRGWTQGVV